MVTKHELLGKGLYVMIAGTVLSWVTLNFTGYFQSAQMKRELEKLFASRTFSKDRVFVGFSTPRYAGLLDAHEDVGFLYFSDTGLMFASETRTLDIPWNSIQRIRFRANAHTAVLLGRWVSIEGMQGGTAIRLLVEPRERATMLGNLLAGPQLKKKLLHWVQKAQAKTTPGKPSK